MRLRLLRIVSLSCMLLFAAGCGTPLRSSAHAEVGLTVWNAYWDIERGSNEYKKMRNRLDAVVYFAAFFDKDDKLTVPQEIAAAKKAAKANAGNTDYLSVVNDKQLIDGTFVQKDLAVLSRVLADDEAMEKHASDIVSIAVQGGYQGIELDYERVWRDKNYSGLPQKFLQFTYKLYRQAMLSDLKLRIVLEPSVPFEAGFCKGPEYVVMLYNLHGIHSGPGPKANEAFIRTSLNKMQLLPGNNTAAAFAAGGCLWSDNGEKRYIDEAEAVKLQRKYDIEPERDASAALHFKYTENAHQYEVWYADSETLNAWITLAADNGINRVSIWRLGGNVKPGRIKR